MIDADENLSDLAKLLNVSVAYVSSVFTGKKPIPEKWLNIIIAHYNLTDRGEEELLNAYSESTDVIKINLSDMNTRNKNLVVRFQRKLDDLKEADLAELDNILKGG